MNQTSIFEYLDTLKLQITDPTQKQLEYFHNKKVIVTSQKQIAILKFKSTQIAHQEPQLLKLRKTLSHQDIGQKQICFHYQKMNDYNTTIPFQ